MDFKIEDIEAICELLKKHKIDQIKVGELVVTKTRHDMPETEDDTTPENDDDLLFYSSN